MPRWDSVQMVKSHLRQLLGVRFIDLRAVELLPSLPTHTRVLLSFSRTDIPTLLIRKRFLLNSFGIFPTRVFKDLSLKPLFSSKRHSGDIRGFDINSNTKDVSCKRSDSIKNRNQSTQGIPSSGADPKGTKYAQPTTVNFLPTQQLAPNLQQDLILLKESPDLIRWDDPITDSPMSKVTSSNPPQLKQKKAKYTPSITHSLPQVRDDFWDLEETHLFSSFSALPQAEQINIIERLNIVKTKLLRLFTTNGELDKSQEDLIVLPSPTSKVISPVCIVKKPEQGGAFKTIDSHTEEGLAVKPNAHLLNVDPTCPKDWVGFQFLQPHELGLPHIYNPPPKSLNNQILPTKNGSVFLDKKGVLEELNPTD